MVLEERSAVLLEGVSTVFSSTDRNLTTSTQNSRLVPPADGHDTTGQVVPSAHGNGPLRISAPGYKTVIDDYVVNASRALGGKYQYNTDLNAGSPLGTGWMQSSIANGTRDSASTAYLEPALSRSNLDVLVTTQVTKLVGSSGAKKPVFRTVEVAQSASSMFLCSPML